jgi:ubiquinone biosynthesis protein Coq4
VKTKPNFREIIAIRLVEWTKPFYVRWFKQRQQAWQQTNDTLLRYPEGSLGKALGQFLEKHQFTLLPKLEDHDVLHVLLNYKTTLVGEIKMQFFLLGNRKRSAYALFTALVGLCLVPEKLRSFYKEFLLGRSCKRVHKWNFEHLLAEPLGLLQKQIFGQSLSEQPIRI